MRVVLACLQPLLAMAPSNLVMGRDIGNGIWETSSEAVRDVTRVEGIEEDVFT